MTPEDRTLQRATQHNLDDAGARIARNREADARLQALIEQLAEERRAGAAEFRAADKQLAERIAALFSGLGEFIRQRPGE